MRPLQVEQFLKRACDIPDHPAVILWGPPGTGKTAVCRKVAVDKKAHLVYLLASLRDPTDAKGLPFPDKGKTVWHPPRDLFPDNPEGKWIYLFDEITLAAPAVQAAFYQIALERRIEDNSLPKDSLVLMASNRPEDRAGVRDMPSPLANRLIHVNFELNVDDWCNWALVNGISAEVIAFIRLNTELLFRFDPTRDKTAFPTPRSIVFADTVYQKHSDAPYLFEAIEGCVGKEWAAKFSGYLKVYKELPDVDAILSGKSTAVPTRADLRYITASLVGTKAKVDQVDAAIRYASRLPKEEGVFLVMLMLRRQGMLQSMLKTPAWREWHKQNKDMLVE